MIKKIIVLFLLSCLLTSCGVKSDPEYVDPDQKVEKITIPRNKT